MEFETTAKGSEVTDRVEDKGHPSPRRILKVDKVEKSTNIVRAIQGSINLKLFDAVATATNDESLDGKRKRSQDDDDEAPEKETEKKLDKFFCQAPGCAVFFECIKDSELHYNERHNYNCSVCRSILPTAHLLDLHILELHDSFFAVMAERKPMYSCLDVDCKEKFQDPDERMEHAIQNHNYSVRFVYKNLLGKCTGKYKKAPKKERNKSKNKKDNETQNDNLEQAEQMETSHDQVQVQEVNGISSNSNSKVKMNKSSSGSGSGKHFSFGQHTGKTFYVQKKSFAVKGKSNKNKEVEKNCKEDINASKSIEMSELTNEVNEMIEERANAQDKTQNSVS